MTKLFWKKIRDLTGQITNNVATHVGPFTGRVNESMWNQRQSPYRAIWNGQQIKDEGGIDKEFSDQTEAKFAVEAQAIDEIKQAAKKLIRHGLLTLEELM